MTKMADPMIKSPVHEQLIAKALARFHDELGKDGSTFSEVSGPEELLVQARNVESLVQGRNKPASSLFRLESILSHISDFAAIVAVTSGAGQQVTGIVWGSLKILLMFVYQNNEARDGVLSMLDELSLALPRFRTYEESLPMTAELESALVDVYAEVTCFCARAIKFFKGSPHGFMIRTGWPKFDDDFKQTAKRLRSLAQIVDAEAEALRLRTDSKKNSELAEALESLKVTNSEDSNMPCHCLPEMPKAKFFGRQPLLEEIGAALTGLDDSKDRCVLLYGLGGVGKTRLALHFATTHRDMFDATLWVTADSRLKVDQSFLKIAQRMGLILDDEQASLATRKVKRWLSETDYQWLIVFDNVDDADVLDYAWPEDVRGSILITARDNAVAFSTPTLTRHVQSFDKALGTSALLSLTGHTNSSEDDNSSAAQIAEALGGLPLAINQIGAFIVQQRLSLPDFISLYEKNAAKIDQRSVKAGESSRTIATIWDMALDRLPESSSLLLGLLAFLDPDDVKESVLTDGASYLTDSDFEFLADDMDFLDAKEPLLRGSLIERRSTDSSLSMHRLVQTAVIQRLSAPERLKLFETAIAVLGYGFPNTWNVVTSHQYSSWAKCELRVPHVKSLIQKSQRHKIRTSNGKDYAELVFRVAWHMYERELYEQSENFLDIGLQILQETDSLMYASACTLQGLVELDTNRLSAALASFFTGLRIREKLLSPDDAFIASSLNAISLCYTELDQLNEAVEHGQRAIDIRLRSNSDRIGNSYSNMASTLLRMGEPDKAEEMLGRCPSLKGFTDDDFLRSGNPRFAGDMVLLSRIRTRQGRTDEALRLASKALTFRQVTHGNRLKTCDSLQQVAGLLEAQSQTSSAIYFLQQSASIAETLPYGEGYVARAYYHLARLYKTLHDERQSQVCKEAAQAARGKIVAANQSPLERNNEYKRYEELVPWMLW